MVEETQKAPERPQLNVQHVDLSELEATFADSIGSVFFDGQTLRIAATSQVAMWSGERMKCKKRPI